jgi:glutamyl-Q tRNA(Asp) synthetase
MKHHKPKPSEPYIGRFAPTPSGDLHFGSLLAAVASYLQAKSKKGKWLIRIEDIDPPREVTGSAGRILHDLKHLGMESDCPVLYQSTQLERYQQAKKMLFQQDLAFRCRCSRKTLTSGSTYPGTCREESHDSSQPFSVRIKTSDQVIRFSDHVQGKVEENIGKDCGDFIIWRADTFPAYQLAVVIDDYEQGVTEVVRGADLLDSTSRQIYLQQLLGLPTPDYAHLPVATLEGKKLGKRIDSDPIGQLDPAELIAKALRFLGHPPPKYFSLDELWEWSIANWDINRVPRTNEIPLDSG